MDSSITFKDFFKDFTKKEIQIFARNSFRNTSGDSSEGYPWDLFQSFTGNSARDSLSKHSASSSENSFSVPSRERTSLEFLNGYFFFRNSLGAEVILVNSSEGFESHIQQISASIPVGFLVQFREGFLRFLLNF